jgi:S1-C subfamily serine protease
MILIQESAMQRSIWRPKRLLLGVTFTLFCLACAESARADSKIYQDVLLSTGLVEVPHPEGRTSYGTCWVVDDEHKLALTSDHLVKAEGEVVVYFPAYRDGTVIPELAHYHRHVAAIHGRVLRRGTQRDLAVLQLDSLPEQVKAMRLAVQSPGPGDAVHSVGNSGVLSGKLWRYTAGMVRSVYQAEIVTEEVLLKARVIETQSPVNGGDSGGPLVNDRGELVGVVNSTQRRSSLVSFSVDVSEVRAFLAEIRDPAEGQKSEVREQ